MSGPSSTRARSAARQRAGSLAELSIDAIGHALSLPRVAGPTLARHLYRYNTLPLSPRWHATFSTATDVAERLALDSLFAIPVRTGRWTETGTLGAPSEWRGWRRAGVRRTRGPVTYKLYVSPELPRLRDVLHASAAVVAGSDAIGFKCGAVPRGLLRPDSIVVYFAARDAMRSTAARLRRALRGARGRGVPFTGSVGAGRLISWGADPAPPDGGGRASSSWRELVCAEVAASVAAHAEAREGGAHRVEAVLADLARRGVDLRALDPASVTRFLRRAVSLP